MTGALREVRSLHDVVIPMPDGVKLRARIWLPEDAETDPVPAILEYLPYRKNDVTARRDALHHPYFAAHGYAGVRVDMRGSGDSEGILEDEYLPQEQDDAGHVIEWLASQPWCSGAVGMMGISWGGFNSLQVAARRPPALKAVVSVCSTDDRYADDVHYIGGAFLAIDGSSWANTMIALNACPPDPAVVGGRWREMWFERMEQSPPFIQEWLSHQSRDEYWKQGSVCENFDAIDCAVYMVGGWADSYRSAVLRFLEGYRGPRKGLIGPWSHQYPHYGVPGPAIGFLQDCLRWWDHWLKGNDTGVMDEPMLRVWLQDSVEPRTFYEERPGRWIGLDAWPSSAVQDRILFPADERLIGTPPHAGGAQRVRGQESSGMEIGAWDAFGAPGHFAPDQRGEDGRWLSFTTVPLDQDIDILGIPMVTLRVASDQPVALVATRLCDVHPEGSSTLITVGILNLTHRESHETPTPLEPGVPEAASFPMMAAGYRVPLGHQLRLSFSPTCWPWAWPSPRPVTLTVFTGETRLSLPLIRPGAAVDESAVRPFENPQTAPPLVVQAEEDEGSKVVWSVDRDQTTGRAELRVSWGGLGAGWTALPGGLEFGESNVDRFSIVEGEPLSARAENQWRVAFRRADWKPAVEARTTMVSDEAVFDVSCQLVATEADEEVFRKTWSFRIPRRLV